MTKLAGVALIIFSCGGWGLLAAAELRRRERRVRDALRLVLRLRTEVCVCRRSLPEALERVREDLPEGFTGISDISGSLEERPFRELWDQLAQQTAPSGRACEAMSDLGEELSGGGDPEKAFDRCEALLEKAEQEAGEVRRRDSRIYIVLGFAAGCVLTLMAL